MQEATGPAPTCCLVALLLGSWWKRLRARKVFGLELFSNSLIITVEIFEFVSFSLSLCLSFRPLLRLSVGVCFWLLLEPSTTALPTAKRSLAVVLSTKTNCETLAYRSVVLLACKIPIHSTNTNLALSLYTNFPDSNQPCGCELRDITVYRCVRWRVGKM